MSHVHNSDVPPCFYRVSIKALVWDETRTKFMVVEEKDGRFEFPGGGLDFGEDPHVGLVREIREEMGLEVTDIADVPVQFFTFKLKPESQYWRATVFYEVKLKDLAFKSSDECVSLRFVTPEEALLLQALPSVPLFARSMLKK